VFDRLPSWERAASGSAPARHELRAAVAIDLGVHDAALATDLAAKDAALPTDVAVHDAEVATDLALLAGEVDDAVVAGIAHLDGCPELAAWVASVDPCAVGDFDLVEVIAGFERVAAWAKGRAAAAAAELSRRPTMNAVWPPQAGRPSEQCGASAELSLRLGISRQAAARLVAVGALMEGRLEQTGRALEAGRIDWGKAVTVAESLGTVPWQVADEVQAAVLPDAPRRTHTQLRRDLERALAEVDPRDAQERHERAVDQRRVERPRVLPDGMASIRAVLPAEAAARLDAALHAAATAARTDGDRRTVDQLRADALDAMATDAWESGWIGPASGCRLRVGRPSARRAQVMVTVGLGTLLGLDERPAELAGYGPVGADVARRIAADGTWRRLLVDEASGVVQDVGRRRYRPPADMADLVRARHTTCVMPTCSTPSWRCDLDHTVPFGRLERPESQDEDRPASGSTSLENLGPACRTDHLFKTHGGFRLSQDGGGTFEVRTPAGHTYVQRPTRPPGVPPPQPRPPRREPRRDDGPPPF
jgi:hypothetical protein